MLRRHVVRVVEQLPDDELIRELRCAQRYAECTTRTRRDMALMCRSCLLEELARRREQAARAGGPSAGFPDGVSR